MRVPPQPHDTEAAVLLAAANVLVRLADEYGLNITIERRPLQPLAMGHVKHVVQVWPRRKSTTTNQGTV